MFLLKALKPEMYGDRATGSGLSGPQANQVPWLAGQDQDVCDVGLVADGIANVDRVIDWQSECLGCVTGKGAETPVKQA